MPDWWLIGIGLLIATITVLYWKGWLSPQAAVGLLVGLAGAWAATLPRGKKSSPKPSPVPEPPRPDKLTAVALAVIEEEAEQEVERTTGLSEDGDLGAEFNRRRP